MARTKEALQSVEKYITGVASKLVAALEEGTAPWQKMWTPGSGSFLPKNGLTGDNYHGANVMVLLSEVLSKGYGENIWITFNQAKQLGGHVRKGEKGTTCFRYLRDVIPVKDENGSAELDAEGNPIVKLMTGMKLFTVFNIAQIDGISPEKLKAMTEPPPEAQWTSVERAEKIISASGAKVRNEDQDRAFYSPSEDVIVMPTRGQFPSADSYYDTLLHELGHWTGHKSRLARDLSGSFGSESYAREELRAEISSMMLCGTLGISHDSSNNASYVASWIKILKNDPKEIFRACSDAEKIQSFVLGFEEKRTWMIDMTNQKVLYPKDNLLWKMAEADTKRSGHTLAEFAAVTEGGPIEAAKAYFERPVPDGGIRGIFCDTPEELWEKALSQRSRYLEKMLAPRAESLIVQYLGKERFEAFKEDIQYKVYLARYQQGYGISDREDFPRFDEIEILLKNGGADLTGEDRFRLAYAAVRQSAGKTMREALEPWADAQTLGDAEQAMTVIAEAKVGGQKLDPEGVEAGLLDNLKQTVSSQLFKKPTPAIMETLQSDRIREVLGWQPSEERMAQLESLMLSAEHKTEKKAVRSR